MRSGCDKVIIWWLRVVELWPKSKDYGGSKWYKRKRREKRGEEKYETNERIDSP